MPTNYPGALDTTTQLPDNVVDATVTAVVHAQNHNNANDAIIAIETELGINPSGAYSTVAAALLDAIAKTPTAFQVIKPSADSVPLAVQLGSGSYISNLFEAHDPSGAVIAFIDHLGNLSAQSLKIAGTALSSANLSDGKQLQRKGQVASFSQIPGVTPGLSGNPQTALQVSGSGTWNLSIAAGSALVQGTDNTAQGMYAITQGTTFTLVLGTQAPVTNPRIDAIVVQYNDSLYTARTPADSFGFVQVVGTPTAGANLTNLNGKPAIPASSVLLAYILVNPGDGGVTNAHVGDARILTGPGVWGEDGHLYRIAINATGQLYLGQVL